MLLTLLLILGGCGTYITDEDWDARLDLDGDGVPNAVDCDADDGAIGDPTPWFDDSDGDGHGAGAAVEACVAPAGHVASSDDCDDSNSDIGPDMAEQCDDADHDCDGARLNGITEPTWYLDSDEDGFGDSDAGFDDCDAPTKHVAISGDCDDNADGVYPNADEFCDGVDNDCDGKVDDEDDDYIDTTWYLDTDGDGHGDPAITLLACDKPNGYVDLGDDCDDVNPLVNGEGVEICDGIDNDCDGLFDDADDSAIAVPAWYADTDSDGFGDPATRMLACDKPAGLIGDGSDCDDSTSSIRPGAPEVCNGIDDDCDGTPDDAALDPLIWYGDADADGFGNPNLSLAACSQPGGFVADDSDCDDGDGTNNPDAEERCDNVDNDCDGTVDFGAVDSVTFYLDNDRDGYGTDAVSLVSCNAPPSYADNSLDCNDANVLIHPGAAELCDGIDNNCDGDSTGSQQTADWFADSDFDGYGDASNALADLLLPGCIGPAGYVLDDTDCDDSDGDLNPGEDEICNGFDDDCDGDIDTADSDAIAPTWYDDDDGDGWGDNGAKQVSCTQPPFTVPGGDDCDDNNADIHPDAEEVCNFFDDDCNLATDDADAGVTDRLEWYVDIDGDGHGDPLFSTLACNAPGGTVAAATDCDDLDVAISPDADERCDGIDNNCDTVVDEAASVDAPLWYADLDGDDWGDAGNTANACDVPADHVADSTDCDDSTDQSYPGALEQCDAKDNDCNGLIDDNVITSVWYPDGDGDGHGTAGTTVDACTRPGGFAATDDDCDDANPTTHPAATELCNGVDDDCDLAVDADDSDVQAPFWYLDGDGDLFGDPFDAVADCTQPTDRVGDGGDCNDADPDIHPAAAEVCDGTDNDCDDDVDDSDSAVDNPSQWYRDADGDSDGDPDNVIDACAAPAGYLATNTDCDDSDAAINSAATEICNGVDDDCDGTVDGPASSGAVLWYADTDDDHYGEASDSVPACTQPTGRVLDDTDCDDGNAFTYPTAPELCDGEDNDCDTVVDNGVVSIDWFADTDTDGFGDPTVLDNDCSQPAGYVLDNTDCDDSEAAVNPGAAEICNDEDDDCDGATDAADPDISDANSYFPDIDEDGYGDGIIEVLACAQPGAYVPNGDDCDDDDAFVNPLAPEVCDGNDNDCDGLPDEEDPSLVDGTTWYLDMDGDLFGDQSTGIVLCLGGDGVTTGGDCDDTNIDINPGEPEVCANGVDDNCDASATPCVAGFAGDTDLSDSTVPALFGSGANDSAGFSLAAVGDLDGDGFGDVAAGAPFATDEVGGGGSAAGALYLVNSVPLTGDIESSSQAIWGVAAGDNFGWSSDGSLLDGNADVDLIVGAPAANSNGTVYILIDAFAEGTTDPSSAIATYVGEAADDMAGTSVAMVGDVTDDGIPDLLVGAPGHDMAWPDMGAAYLLSGADLVSGGLDTAHAKLKGFGLNNNAGHSVAGLDDFSGDGVPDVLIAAPTYGFGATQQRGQNYLFEGPFSGDLNLRGDQDAVFTGVAQGHQAGRVVASAGDVDNDGLNDLLLSAPFHDAKGSNTGVVYVVRAPFGSWMVLSSAAAVIIGEDAGDEFGQSVAALGDTNGDGPADIAIGAPLRDEGGSSKGTAYVFEGPLSGTLDASSAAARFVGYHDSQHAGWSLAGPGDFDADTNSDLVIGANWDDGGAEKSGAIYFLAAPGAL